MENLSKICVFVMLLLVMSSLTQAAVLEVGQSGGDVGTLADVYPNIQAAIDDAGPNDVIIVHDGTYDETLDIDGKINLTLQGESKENTIIKSTSTISWAIPEAPQYDGRTTVVRIYDSNVVTIENMTFDCNDSKGTGGYPGVMCVIGWDSEVTVDNCILKNMSVDDLSGGYYEVTSYFRAPGYTDGDRATITFTGNTFIDPGRVGIVLHDYIYGDVSGNTFYKTTDDFGYGIEMGSQSTGQIVSNTIYGYDTPAASDGSESAGIYVENCFTGGSPSVAKDVLVQDNEVYDCQYAMWIGNGYNGYAGDVDVNLTLVGNNFHDNVWGGLIVQDEDAEAGSSITLNGSGNTVVDNNEVGYWIFTQGDGDITVDLTDETISGNDSGVYVVDYASGASTSSYDLAVNNSKINGNGSYGIENTVSTIVVDAESNWWGDATGPYDDSDDTGTGGLYNPSGLGDPVTDYVDYAPWYASESLSMPVIVYVDDTNAVRAYAETIQAGIDAAYEGDRIEVSAGTYPENINIDKSLTLQSSSGAAGTTIAGSGGIAATITADNVDVNGFTITNPSGKGAIYSTDNSYITITNNIITDVGSSDASTSGTNYGIAIVSSVSAVDGITITNNQINQIRGGNYRSADAIAIGWSTGTEPVTGLLIQQNDISDITSDIIDYASGGRGAYGILINHGTHGAQTIGAQILDNTITDLEGLWAHAIGLEGDTPDALVLRNDISNLVDHKDPNDAVGVMIEDNPSSSSVTIACSTFENVAVGVANVTGSGLVNAEDNWWGDASGPSGAGAGSGAAVTPNVDFFPWLLSTDCNDTALVAPDYVVDDDWAGLPYWTVVNVEGIDYYIGLNAFDTIQGAIDAASDGNNIKVAAGTYNEAVLITKSLNIRGATADLNKNGYPVPANYNWDPNVESIINHPNPTGGYTTIVDIEDVNDVTFQGFVVQELYAVGNLNSSLLRVYAHTHEISNINVRNNVIGGNTNVTSQDGTQGRMGLYIVNHPYSDKGVVNSTFAGNKIFDCKGNGDNIFLWSAYYAYGAPGPASMHGTVIEDNEIYGSHRAGIETAGGYSDLIIRHNAIYGNSGLPSDDPNHLKYGNGILLIRGSSDKLGGATTAYGPVNMTIKGNEIFDNEKNGIYSGPILNDVSITGNEIYDNGWDAVRVDLEGTYWNPTFEPEPNDWSCYDGAWDVEVSYNNLFDNGAGAELIGTPTNGLVIDAEYNFWGDASGPEDTIGTMETDGTECYDVSVILNADGLGDSVSENVDYCPWLSVGYGGSCPAGDLDGDCDVDWYDFAIMAANWLVGTD